MKSWMRPLVLMLLISTISPGTATSSPQLELKIKQVYALPPKTTPLLGARVTAQGFLVVLCGGGVYSPLLKGWFMSPGKRPLSDMFTDQKGNVYYIRRDRDSSRLLTSSAQSRTHQLRQIMAAPAGFYRCCPGTDSILYFYGNHKKEWGIFELDGEGHLRRIWGGQRSVTTLLSVKSIGLVAAIGSSIYEFRRGKEPKLLFQASKPILSAVVTDRGALLYTTTDGLFSVVRDLMPVKQSSAVGIITSFHETLYLIDAVQNVVTAYTLKEP